MATETEIPTRELGRQGLTVSALGLGCMGMSQSYGPGDEKESIATIQRAIDLGVFFLDTANVYGEGENERLVGRRPRRPARSGRTGQQVRHRARRRQP